MLLPPNCQFKVIGQSTDDFGLTTVRCKQIGGMHGIPVPPASHASYLRRGLQMDADGYLKWLHDVSNGQRILEMAKCGESPLQLALRFNAPESVQVALLEASPEAVMQNDHKGNTHLHTALSHRVGDEVVLGILKAWPGGANITDSSEETPLCCALESKASEAVLLGILSAWPEAAKTMSGFSKDTPLQCALKHQAPDAVVLKILQAWPKAASIKSFNDTVPLCSALVYRASDAVVLQILRAWPEGIRKTTMGGLTPLWHAIQLKTSQKVVSALFLAWPDAILETCEVDGRRALDLMGSAKDVIGLFSDFRLNQLSANVPIAMLLGSIERYKQMEPSFAQVMQACVQQYFILSTHLESTPFADYSVFIVPASSFDSSCVKARYDEMLYSSNMQNAGQDTKPISEQLQPIKDALNIFFQLDLSFMQVYTHKQLVAASVGNAVGVAAPADSIGPKTTPFSCKRYTEMHVDPAIHLIQRELEAVKVQVRAAPQKYRQLLADLSNADRVIYNESFGKTIKRQHGGNEAAYETMLQKCAGMKDGRALVNVQQQPTSELIPLVLMVRANIPEFKAAVEAVVAQAFPAAAAPNVNAAAVAVSLPTVSLPAPASFQKVSFRPETKAPYRIIEKALTKGPNPDYPDVSKVLDVFGCLIDCADYVEMAAVVQAFADQHNAGKIDIARVKDRWTTPSSGGWRDLMLNLVINGVVFEVQIVLRAMLGARKVLDAHKAYNQFRSFVEVFDLLDLSPELDQHAIGGEMVVRDTSSLSIDGGDDGVSGLAHHDGEVEELKRKLAASEEARVEAEAVRAVSDAALAVSEKQRIAAQDALAASTRRNVELEAEIERCARSAP